MRQKILLVAGLSVMTVMSPFARTSVRAEAFPDTVYRCCVDAENISPRYSYIESAVIGVHPNDSETVYILDIRGTSLVNSISGTATLYKETSSGNYVKIDSEKLYFKGNDVDYTGSLASDGSGKYKLEFVGTIYTDSGSEPVTFRNYGSY